jgi:hypothetical protein
MAVFLACSGQLSGINAIIYYGPTIFAKAGFAMDSALTQQVTLGMVNVLFTILAMWQVDRMGRRPLLLVGNAGVFISLAMIGLMFATGMNGRPLVFFMCSFLACFAFSLGPLPWVFMAEIFPTRVRGLAVSIATLSLWSVNTVICLSFPTLAQKLGPWLVERGVTRWLPWIKEENLGPAGAFWVFALLVTPVFYFVLRVMPETKNRSLEELERYFLHGE